MAEDVRTVADAGAPDDAPGGLRHSLAALRRSCAFNGVSFTAAAGRHLLDRLRGRRLFRGPAARILGLANLSIDGFLKLGFSQVGFVDGHDRTLVRVRGRMKVAGRFSIAQGCRIDVGPGAFAEFRSGYLNPFTRIVCMHGISFGEDCAVSWDCQFLDEDFHEVIREGQPPSTGAPIRIGNHVWFGNGVVVLKGVVIPDGCIVAAGSVVRSVFTEENCLIGGAPARVIRRNVSWR